MKNVSFNDFLMVRFFAWLMFVAAFLIIPWDEVRGGFVDFIRYQRNFAAGVYSYRIDSGWILAWRDEALWRWGVTELATALSGYERAFHLIIVACVAGISFYPIIASRSGLGTLVLFSPQFVDLTHSQVRSAVAMALIYLAISIFGVTGAALISATLLIAAGLVHTFAMVPILLIVSFIVTEKFLSKHPKRQILVLFAVILTAIFAISIKGEIFSALGDRRAYTTTIGSGLLLNSVLLSTTIPAWVNLFKMKIDLASYLVVGLCCISVSLFVTSDSSSVRVVAMAAPALAVVISTINRGSRYYWLAYVCVCHAAYFSIWIGGSNYV